LVFFGKILGRKEEGGGDIGSYSWALDMHGFSIAATTLWNPHHRNPGNIKKIIVQTPQKLKEKWKQEK
jgi:hypothetical protein